MESSLFQKELRKTGAERQSRPLLLGATNLMRPSRWISLLAFLLLTFSLFAATEEQPPIKIEPLNPGPESEIQGRLDRGQYFVTNGVVVTSGDMRLIAQTASVDEQSGEMFAEGNVSLQQGGGLWRGECLHYNFKTKEIRANTFRAGLPPFFAEGQGLGTIHTNQIYSATNVVLTTDDVAVPGYYIRARSVKITPGKSIEAERATIYAGKTPIMFLPYFSRSLAQHPNFFSFTPGYRSLYGPYLLGAYRWHWSTNLSGGLNLDYRQKRGVGLGPDLNYDLGRFGQGALSYYYLKDGEPGRDPAGMPIRENRHRVEFSHQATIRTNLTARVVVRKQSDAQVIRDFFETEYRHDPQPKSFLEVNQLWPNFSLNVLVQPQLNDFFQTVERLPDVKLYALRQQLGASPIYYEGENSFAYLRFQPTERSATNDYAALRADSFHQLLLPRTLFGWLNVTPRIGGRFTHYGETEGQGTVLDEKNRTVFNTGAEVSFKVSRTWEDARSKAWDVDGLRHILQPSFNYVFVPSPSRAPRELPQFDTEIPSLRLLPIDFPDYNSIDSIDSQDVLRLGLRNKVQTKRKEGLDHLVNWALYTDWRLDPRSDQTTFADFFSDLDLKPRSWLMLSSEVRFDVVKGRLNLANHTLTVAPQNVWSVSLGHWYFRTDPRFGPESENNLIHSSLYYRFNENWGARLTHHYEARDGVLEEQYYTLYRDLRSWTAALTFRVREHRTGPTDYTVALSFSFKAFPRFGLGKDRDLHSWLLGG